MRCRRARARSAGSGTAASKTTSLLTARARDRPRPATHRTGGCPAHVEGIELYGLGFSVPGARRSCSAEFDRPSLILAPPLDDPERRGRRCPPPPSERATLATLNPPRDRNDQVSSDSVISENTAANGASGWRRHSSSPISEAKPGELATGTRYPATSVQNARSNNRPTWSVRYARIVAPVRTSSSSRPMASPSRSRAWWSQAAQSQRSVVQLGLAGRATTYAMMILPGAPRITREGFPDGHPGPPVRTHQPAEAVASRS